MFSCVSSGDLPLGGAGRFESLLKCLPLVRCATFLVVRFSVPQYRWFSVRAGGGVALLTQAMRVFPFSQAAQHWFKSHGSDAPRLKAHIFNIYIYICPR